MAVSPNLSSAYFVLQVLYPTQFLFCSSNCHDGPFPRPFSYSLFIPCINANGLGESLLYTICTRDALRRFFSPTI